MNHLHPHTISPPTFHHLLEQYPKTVESLARRKASAKIKRKIPAAEGSKGKKLKTSLTTPATTAAKTEGEEDYISSEVNEFLSLDEFRYEGLPGLVTARAEGKDDDEDGSGYLEKEDLVRLVEWKMKHGTFRPALLGLIRSNSESAVRDATRKAFKALSSARHTTKGGSEKFPSEALDILTKALRGVGVATASLILSLASDTTATATAVDVPFYSDDVYLWVCMEEIPTSAGSGEAEAEAEAETEAADRLKRGIYKRLNGELNVKYTMAEYRGLWEGVKRLRERLGQSDEGVSVSVLEVEKVALVVKHYTLLGGIGNGQGDDVGDKKVSSGVKMEEEGEGEEPKREKRKLQDEQPTGEGRRRSKRLDSRRMNPA
ncbi:hypothetical protein AbraIFM66951_001882 [Aspergillus brasiliensis]|uniref:EF-hand domain-containing protein n=1 Tax=Aspergillus brasiliensis TaxID=319629 RepID=A0A9W5YLM0_9EURO|nr:hypothetical protein AbraCBS73388_002679 [Aspergillus brasiliensis]GKZ42490.1 hypothetical protein AbraIFM66951_001882 [Aspergillus brasiliensis]